MLKPSAELTKDLKISTYSLVVGIAKKAREIAEDAEIKGEILIDKPVDMRYKSTSTMILKSWKQSLVRNAVVWIASAIIVRSQKRRMSRKKKQKNRKKHRKLMLPTENERVCIRNTISRTGMC